MVCTVERKPGGRSKYQDLSLEEEDGSLGATTQFRVVCIPRHRSASKNQVILRRDISGGC